MIFEPAQIAYSLAAFAVVALTLACDRGEGDEMVPLSSSPDQRILSASTPRPDSGDNEPAVAVWVNDVPIHVEDVERRLDQIQRLYRHSRRPFGQSIRETKRRHVLERLIEKELLRQHLSASLVEVDDDDVDEVVAYNLEAVFGSKAALHRYLDEQGISAAEYREKIRHEIALDRLLAKESEDTAIDEAIITELYERLASRRPARERVEASVLVVRVPAGTSETVRERIKEATRQAVVEVDSKEAFATLAQKMSQGPTADRGGYVGWVERGVLPQMVDDIVFDAALNRPTPPIPTPVGFEVYWIHQRRQAGIRSFDEVEEVLRERARRAQADRARHSLLKSLRNEANVRYADDPIVEDIR